MGGIVLHSIFSSSGEVCCNIKLEFLFFPIVSQGFPCRIPGIGCYITEFLGSKYFVLSYWSLLFHASLCSSMQTTWDSIYATSPPYPALPTPSRLSMHRWCCPELMQWGSWCLEWHLLWAMDTCPSSQGTVTISWAFQVLRVTLVGHPLGPTQLLRGHALHPLHLGCLFWEVSSLACQMPSLQSQHRPQSFSHSFYQAFLLLYQDSALLSLLLETAI